VFCERCGTRLEAGALICIGCGTLQSPGAEVPHARVEAPPREELKFEGPLCAEHPGMPLLGRCPRCGRDVCVRCAPEAVNDVLTCTRCTGLTVKHAPAPDGAKCATHADAAAAFICARCGTFACASCQATGIGSEGLCVKCQVSAGTLASRGSRFGANLVDTFVMIAVIFLCGVGAAFVSRRQPGLRDIATLGMVIGVFVAGAIQLVAQLSWEQSIGKRLFGIQVVKLDGSPVEVWRLLLMRNLLSGLIAQLCSIYAIADALSIFAADQRCLHDHLAGTTVVERPRE
jgi:uncharacterized RDD family membrane protein YckC